MCRHSKWCKCARVLTLGLVIEKKHEFPTIHSNLYSLIFIIFWDVIAVLVVYIPLLALCLKQRIVWLVTLMCCAPLFCIASHSGYIIVTWLSDNQHGGPAIFFYIISFSYYFIIFRQLYKYCNRKRHQEAEEPAHPCCTLECTRLEMIRYGELFSKFLLCLVYSGAHSHYC